MEDSRIRTLKDLINSFRFLEQFMNSHMQCINSEERGLRQSMDNWETTHRTFERLGNLQDLQELLDEYQRQKNKILSTIQTFLDYNKDLRGTKYYLEATNLIQKQKALECPNTEQTMGQLDGGNQTLAAAEGHVVEVDPQHADQKLSKAN
ncbi:uncharacterized protein [Drosophila kikkawai]|uniref:Uncharacterized protein n=1 Tax=Drosophila kikkawai TaxID=30033 RepID=A0A6P4JS04_DROKI|nr:uncharacterized protein LOC108085410 [Drosophila kikkawai]